MILAGFEIRRFLFRSILDPKLADAFVRMLRLHENATMAKRTKSPGRHYVSPSWAVRSLCINIINHVIQVALLIQF